MSIENYILTMKEILWQFRMGIIDRAERDKRIIEARKLREPKDRELHCEK